MTPEEFDLQLEAANRRGLEFQVAQIHALSVRYHRESGALVLELRGGLTLWVPTHLLQGVAGQSSELIERVALRARGSALHWEELDADFSVQGLAAGSFGSKSWMQKLEEGGLLDASSIERRRALDALQSPTAASIGRKGGAARSETKSAASRTNGAKGGRPRKQTADV